MIKEVVFYNSWHFGDLHSNKEYVREFMKAFNAKGITCTYATMVSPRAVNLPMKCVSIYDYPHLVGNPPTYYDQVSNIMYINTWIGYYLTMHNHNFQAQIPMWQDIAFKVMEASKGGIIVKIVDEPMKYVSNIDVDLLAPFNIPEGDKVLICNDIPVSGQSHNGTWESAVNRLANDFPNKNFICTNVINAQRSNIIFTNNLTNRSAIICDLPEIAHLSSFCEVIVTNSSGPGTFCMTKSNFENENKKLIGFLVVETNAYWHGVDGVRAKTYHFPFFDDDRVYQAIKDVINS